MSSTRRGFVGPALAGVVLGCLLCPRGRAEEVTPFAKGPLPIRVAKGVLYKPPKVRLVRVWKYNRDQSSAEWLKEKYGAKRVVRVEVEGTPYSLLMLDGKVMPLISVSGPWEIWHLEGLDRGFGWVTDLRPGKQKLELVAPGGDMRHIWLLDFRDGLRIGYREEYDGF